MELKLLTLASQLDMSRSTVEPRNAQLLDHIDAWPKGWAVAMDPLGAAKGEGTHEGLKSG